MPFRFDKLTQKAQEAVQQAQALAGENGHQGVHPLHVLVALTTEREGIVRPVLEKCGVQPDALLNEAQRQLNSIPKVTGQPGGMYISPALNQVFEAASKEAETFKDEFISTEHLLLGIADQKYDPSGALLNRMGATRDAILKALVAVRGTQRVTDQNPESKYQAL
jgi:ATP-dependent Clp protease ATP-binding subunit ClpB